MHYFRASKCNSKIVLFAKNCSDIISNLHNKYIDVKQRCERMMQSIIVGNVSRTKLPVRLSLLSEETNLGL